MSTADFLNSAGLKPTGGTWGAMLFENESVGYGSALTWSFTIDCDEVVDFTAEDEDRDIEPGSSPVSITVDWLPMPRCDWRAMAGLRGGFDGFGDGGESSVYYFAHHRYDRAEVVILEQDSTRLLVRLTVRGDVDDLGPDELECQAWLDFRDLTVSRRGGETATEAFARLQAETVVDGLVPGNVDNSYARLVPAER